MRFARSVCALLAAIIALGACERRYPQDSAQAVLDSAREMVAEGRADRLTDLIYAETPEERRLLDRVGDLLGSMQDLAVEVQKAYPDEVDKLRRDAIRAAEQGEADDVLSRVLTGSRAMSPRDERADPGEMLNTVMLTILVDPYAFLEENEDRLTAVPIADDMAAVQWDGKPVFGPLVGLTMRETEGRWQIVLPTHLPPVKRVLDDPDMRQMLGDFVVTVDNAVIDLREDVRTGEARTLEEAASRAGENALPPLMMVMFAMGKYQDAAREEARQAQDDADAPG